MYDSMIFYRSFYEGVKELPPETQVQIYDAVFSYSFNGIVPELEGIALAMFRLIKPQIDANNERKENGKKGGRPPKNKPMVIEDDETKKPMVMKNYETKKPNVNVNVNANDNANENVNANENENVNDNANASKEKNKKEKPVYYPNDELLDKAFRDYVDHRKQIKKPMSEKAVELAIEKLNKLSAGDSDTAIQIINQSIGQGWQGLFELKEDKPNKPNKPDESVFDAWARS